MKERWKQTNNDISFSLAFDYLFWKPPSISLPLVRVDQWLLLLDFIDKVAWNAHCVCMTILMVGDVSSFVPNFSPLCCWLIFAFMVDTIMENGRHLGIFKNAAGLFNMFVVLTRMAYSSTVYFEFIIPFSS